MSLLEGYKVATIRRGTSDVKNNTQVSLWGIRNIPSFIVIEYRALKSLHKCHTQFVQVMDLNFVGC